MIYKERFTHNYEYSGFYLRLSNCWNVVANYQVLHECRAGTSIADALQMDGMTRDRESTGGADPDMPN